MSNSYDWKFCTLAGVTRVSIESGQDIAHLGELDKKLWTVLSCPVNGLEFDPKTLALMDTDGDGKIKVDEVVAAAEWLTSILKDPDALLKQEDTIPLDAFNEENETGKRLKGSAQQILKNLGLEKDSISVADTSDSVAIFAKTVFNGDGIITEAAAGEDEDLKKAIAAVIATFGAAADRSGVDGINAEKVELFYTACADYAAWKGAAGEEVFPYGDNTEAALAACEALKVKIADYFMRCKLGSFDADAVGALDVSVEKIAAISGEDLSACAEQIASYPLARICGKSELPLAIESINPSWQAAFATLKTLVFDVDFKKKDSITEAEWLSVLAKFDAFQAWKAAKKGAEVESLGDDVNAILAADKKAALLDLIEKDKALESESTSIDEVDKLTHLYRDFYCFLNNYVTFKDFYSLDEDVKAIFQAGVLYVDERSCDLCVKVSDMGAHGNISGLSGMFIAYCSCVCKTSGDTMTIAAVITDGDVKNLREGKHGVFYDRSGKDWDATIVKIVDNPISVRQAFWSPYKKFGKFIEGLINKSAADKDSKMMGDITGSMESAAAAPGAPAAEKKFDIAKFAGIFAAIGMAIAYLSKAIVDLCKGIAALHWWQLLLVIAGIMLLISGPAMIMAAIKLRKRNLAPVLNANGWAVNSAAVVNIKFGTRLTSTASVPKLKLSDPYEQKMPLGKKILLWIAGLAVVFGILFFTNSLKCIGLPFHKDEPVEEVVTETEEASEPAPAEETATVAAE